MEICAARFDHHEIALKYSLYKSNSSTHKFVCHPTALFHHQNVHKQSGGSATRAPYCTDTILLDFRVVLGLKSQRAHRVQRSRYIANLDVFRFEARHVHDKKGAIRRCLHISRGKGSVHCQSHQVFIFYGYGFKTTTWSYRTYKSAPLSPTRFKVKVQEEVTGGCEILYWTALDEYLWIIPIYHMESSTYNVVSLIRPFILTATCYKITKIARIACLENNLVPSQVLCTRDQCTIVIYKIQFHGTNRERLPAR